MGRTLLRINGRRFPIAMGQRLDIRLTLPGTSEAFPILALREGARERTGIVLAPATAPVRKFASEGKDTGPVVDLVLEQALRAPEPLISREPDKRFNMALVGSMQG